MLVAYFLEVGLVLIFVPWSTFWDRNLFAEAVPALHAALQNNFVRGAISGVGVINLVAGFFEFVALLVPVRSSGDVTDRPPVGIDG